MSRAKEAAISFDISKTELIHFYSKRTTIEEGLKLGAIEISPKPLVRWLGVFLDSKLTFKQYVKTKISKEKAAFYLVKRLGNTQRGLSLQALRQLYIACITTIADYGIQCWWKSKSRDHLLARYQSLQNEALKLVLGAFKRSPSQAIEIKASIPPPRIRFEKLCNNYALRILKFKENHVIKKAYIEENNKDRDELAASSSSSSKNSTIRHLLQPKTQLLSLVSRVQQLVPHWEIERTALNWQKPWSPPISASFFILKGSKEEAIQEHLRLVENLQESLEWDLVDIYYTDGSKDSKSNAAAICKIGERNRIKYATNWNLGPYMEIIDAELYAVYRALEYLKQQRLEEKQVYIFIDSQAAIKRLQLNALTGGQELVFKITQSCSYLASKGISINFYWVPSHLGIYGNEIADKLAKKGLSRRKLQSSYTSLAYLGRRAREKILEQWKDNWQQNKSKGKHYIRICKGNYPFSFKAPKDKYPKKLQSASFQLKLGKGYFKSFSKTVGMDKEGRCFRECNSIQTTKHLLLDCSLYKIERKEM